MNRHKPDYWENLQEPDYWEVDDYWEEWSDEDDEPYEAYVDQDDYSEVETGLLPCYVDDDYFEMLDIP